MVLMKSFAYLVPRVFILGLCLLAAVLGADPIVRYLLLVNLQTEVGAKVSISRISSDLADGKIYLRDLSVADPDSPMENLFQSDLTYLKFSQNALFDRQFVVEQARTSHVRFGAPRTQSGALPNVSQRIAEGKIDKVVFEDSQDEIRTAWLDQFQEKLKLNESADLPVTLFAVAKATNERWNRDFELHHQQLESVNQKIVQLVNTDPMLLDFRNRNSLDQRAANEQPQRPVNPLRKVSASEKVPAILKQALTAIDDLKRQQLILQKNASADIEALDVAFENDIMTKSKVTFDQDIGVLPKTITDLLLAKFHRQAAADAIEWLVWLQAKRDAATGPIEPIRGVAFFQERFPLPSLVIENVEIDGEGNFANEHFHFAGHAYDLSNNPAGHDRPARFELRAQGQRHFRINCVMDQRGGDQLVIEFPSFHLGEQLLGSESEMLVSLSPGTKINGRIELNADRERLIGTMTLDFSNVALVVQNLNELAGGKEIEVRLNHQLSTLNQFQTSSQISGKIASPTLSLQSDLGQQIAHAMESVSDLTKKNSLAVRNRKIEDFYRFHVRPLQQNIRSEVDKISGALNDQISQTEEIQQTQRTAAARWPAIR